MPVAFAQMPGGHFIAIVFFCLFALAAILPLIPAKMRGLDPGDWLAQDNLVACPDPDERLIMKIERIGERELRADELT